MVQLAYLKSRLRYVPIVGAVLGGLAMGVANAIPTCSANTTGCGWDGMTYCATYYCSSDARTGTTACPGFGAGLKKCVTRLRKLYTGCDYNPDPCCSIEYSDHDTGKMCC